MRRRAAASWGPLRALARQQDDERLSLRGLWALNVTGGFGEDFAAEMLKHKGEHVRAWTVRLLGDAKGVSPSIAKRLAELAATDPSAGRAGATPLHREAIAGRAGASHH